MRLLLDEMLSPAVAEALRADGFDVRAVCGDAQLQGLPDDQVLSAARADRRALVTNNIIDFRPLHVDAVTPGGDGHWGIVFVPSSFRRTRADTGRLIRALADVLTAFPDEAALVDGEWWL